MHTFTFDPYFLFKIEIFFYHLVKLHTQRHKHRHRHTDTHTHAHTHTHVHATHTHASAHTHTHTQHTHTPSEGTITPSVFMRCRVLSNDWVIFLYCGSTSGRWAATAPNPCIYRYIQIDTQYEYTIYRNLGSIHSR